MEKESAIVKAFKIVISKAQCPKKVLVDNGCEFIYLNSESLHKNNTK